jgi:hypothetical protein
MVRRLAVSFAERVRREAGSDPARQVERVYRIALSRPPGDAERAIGVDALRELADAWAEHAAGKSDRDVAGLKALTTYCHAVMNSAGFLYVD